MCIHRHEILPTSHMYLMYLPNVPGGMHPSLCDYKIQQVSCYHTCMTRTHQVMRLKARLSNSSQLLLIKLLLPRENNLLPIYVPGSCWEVFFNCGKSNLVGIYVGT